MYVTFIYINQLDINKFEKLLSNAETKNLDPKLTIGFKESLEALMAILDSSTTSKCCATGTCS